MKIESKQWKTMCSKTSNRDQIISVQGIIACALNNNIRVENAY